MKYAIVSGFLSLFILVGCGGSSDSGGNAGAGGATNTGTLNLTFSPNILSDEIYQGQDKYWSFNVFATGDITEQVYIQVVDSIGIISPNVEINAQSSTRYNLRFQSADNIAAGDYNGSIEVKVCKDSQCTIQFGSSPFSLPISLNVKSTSNITPLASVEGFEGWTASIDALNRYSKYVPLTLNVDDFSVRWVYEINENDHSFSYANLVAKNNIVMFTEYYEVDDNSVRNLVSLNEVDGQELWKTYLDESEYHHRLNIDEEVLHIFRSEGDIINFNIDSGAEISTFNGDNSLQLDSTVTPLFLSDTLITSFHCRENGLAICAIDLPTNEVIWDYSNPADDPFRTYHTSTVTVKGDSLFFVDSSSHIKEISAVTGEEINRTFVNAQLEGYHSEGQVFMNDGIVIYSQNSGYDFTELYAVNLETSEELWSEEVFNVSAKPIINGDKLYFAREENNAAAKHVLEQRNITTGEIEIIIPIEEQKFSINNMIVTNNLVFLGTDSKTVAYDLTTQKKVWELPFGGMIAMSDYGVLYVGTFDGDSSVKSNLYAINLKGDM